MTKHNCNTTLEKPNPSVIAVQIGINILSFNYVLILKKKNVN